MRGREEERTGAVVQEINEGSRPRDVAAQHADRFGQRPHLHVDTAVKGEMVNRAASVLSKYAACVRVIHHHDAAEFLGKIAQIRQRAEIAVHTEYAVADDELSLGPRQFLDDTARRRRRRDAGKTLMVARLRRAPSMMLAWFSSSETMASSRPRIAATVPAFAAKPL